MRKFDEISVPETENLTEAQLVSIGKKLKELRVINGLTLNDVAFFLFCAVSTVEGLERGRLSNITLLTLMKFAVFYKIPVKDLLM